MWFVIYHGIMFIWRFMVDLSVPSGVIKRGWNTPNEMKVSSYLEIVDFPAMFDYHRAMGQMMIRNDGIYHRVISHSHGKSQFLIGKPSINGPFSMAMLNNQRVFLGVQVTLLVNYPTASHLVGIGIGPFGSMIYCLKEWCFSVAMLVFQRAMGKMLIVPNPTDPTFEDTNYRYLRSLPCMR